LNSEPFALENKMLKLEEKSQLSSLNGFDGGGSGFDIRPQSSRSLILKPALAWKIMFYCWR
jgi:hypothetical protein